MRVLVACEFSGAVRDAFAARGHDAWSCDLLPSETPGQHIVCDALSLDLSSFDILIAHPPCTHLAVSGARWWPSKKAEQEEAIQLFRAFLLAPVARVAVENPVGILSRRVRKPDQIIQPWELWLRGLPKLKPSNVVEGREPRVHHEPPGEDRWARRSRTLPGIAAAMAEQWGAVDVPLFSAEQVPLWA